jgi:zinc protease
VGLAVAEVHHVALPGFDLLVRRKPGVPLVNLGVYFPRTEFDPVGGSGVSALAIRSAVRGAGDLGAERLAFAFERLGGTLATSVSLDWLGFGTTVLSRHLAEAASLVELVRSSPMYREDQVAAERGLLVEETTQVSDDMFRYPFQLAFAAAFGERGYGVPASGWPSEIEGVTAAAVRGWHRRAVLDRRGVVLAVGDLDVDAALMTLESVFGQQGQRAPAPLTTPVSWVPERDRLERVVERDKKQSAFAMVFPGPARRDADRHAAEVWCAVASGLGGRLFEALRDRRSLAYTVVASSWQKARAGAFVSYIATAPAREEEARREMLRELERFAVEPVRPGELYQAINYLAGQTAVNRQSASAVAGEILDAWLAGGGLADMVDPAERYRAVSAEEVRNVAARTLAGARAEGVVRGTR